MVNVVHYEDIMDEINDRSALRTKLIRMVEQHKILHITGLSSAQRHLIYSQMYYPLKFEKIANEEGDPVIKIFNSKKKNTAERSHNERVAPDTSFVEVPAENREKGEEDDEDDEGKGEESEEDSGSSYEESYVTDYEENFEKLENMSSQIVDLTNNVITDVKSIRFYVRMLFVFNVMGWALFYCMDPVRIVVLNTNNNDNCIAY
jgi:hypothetical protein